MKELTYEFDVEFASQTEMTSIPAGYINKTVCGCGLTSLAIEKEANNVVIAVPTITLVNNKVSQYPNERMPYKLLGVTGETDEKEISDYVYNCLKAKVPYKVMVTYDSIKKVEFLLNDSHLIIDESDCLLKYAKMKAQSKKGDVDVINYLLDVAEQYKDTVSFISATPVPIKYFERKWMEEMDYIVMNWSNTVKVRPILLPRTWVKQALIEEILKPLIKNDSVTIGNKTFSKVIVFFNSVTGIKDVVKKVKLDPADCGIICSNSVRNDYVLSDGSKLDRIEDFSNLPKFTFVTSTGFNGCDIYDKEAMNVVVSDVKKNWTLLDINTDLKQAISRQRMKNNPNYSSYIMIYNYMPSKEELADKVVHLQDRLQSNCSVLCGFKDDKETYNHTLESFLAGAEFNYYTNKVGECYAVNHTAINTDKYFIEETLSKYKSGEWQMDASNIIEKPAYVKEYSYTTMYDKYVNYVVGAYEFTEDEKESDSFLLLDKYYKTFGKLEKDSSYAKDRLEAEGSFKAVGLSVLKYFNRGNRYTNKEVKSKLQTAYAEIGLNRKAKATDVFELFGSKVKAVKNNGERFIEFI